jgi:predicted 2-oxoglutarate/Fe(II)-dependent dioxygenase YbiX
MHYEVSKIITDDQRHALIDLYNSMPSSIAHQDYNLHTVDKRQITSSVVDSMPPKAKEALLAVEGTTKRKSYSHYFVMYEEGAFTKLHTDNDAEVGLTIVTLVDTVDLIGGDTLVMLPYEEKEKKGYQKGNSPRGSVIPKIVRMESGESVTYDHSLTHGVTQVERGKRLVLVSWFMYPQEEEVAA